MRFPFATLAAAMHRPLREIERADRVVALRAPEGWTDVQVEAWLDWAETDEIVTTGEDVLAEMAAALQDLGCDYGQGFGYAPALSPQEAEVYLNEAYVDGAAPVKARG